MVHINSVIRGLSKYVDCDLVPKLDGWQKWALGAGAALIFTGIPAKFNEVRKIPFVSYMAVIDENGMITNFPKMTYLYNPHHGGFVKDVPATSYDRPHRR